MGEDDHSCEYQLRFDQIISSETADAHGALETQLLIERRLHSHLPTLIALSYERPRRLTSSLQYQSLARARYQLRHAHYLEKHLIEFADSFRYIEGRKVEDIPAREIAVPGSVKLITDLYGPISYSPELVQILRTYGELLATNGQLHIAVGDGLLKIIEPSTGRELSLFDFIESYCEGFRVVRGQANPTLVRTKATVKVPQLQIVSFISGSPSILTYSLLK